MNYGTRAWKCHRKVEKMNFSIQIHRNVKLEIMNSSKYYRSTRVIEYILHPAIIVRGQRKISRVKILAIFFVLLQMKNYFGVLLEVSKFGF